MQVRRLSLLGHSFFYTRLEFLHLPVNDHGKLEVPVSGGIDWVSLVALVHGVEHMSE